MLEIILRPKNLKNFCGKIILVFHGAAEMFLNEKWLKMTPAFNKKLCEYLRVEPLEFDGETDSIFQEFDKSGNVFMEYLHDYGDFDDLPYELYLAELTNIIRIFSRTKNIQAEI